MNLTNPTGWSVCHINPSRIVILRKEWRAGKKQDAGRRKAPRSSIALHPHPRDDSGPVLTSPPNRLGGTAFGDFGGKSCCTFRSGLRSSSEPRPGYSLLPHLYQDVLKISFTYANGQIPDSRITIINFSGVTQLKLKLPFSEARPLGRANGDAR